MTKRIGSSPFVYTDDGAKALSVANPDGSNSDLAVNFASVSAIPSGFVGTARVGTDLYVGDGVAIRLTTNTNFTKVKQGAVAILGDSIAYNNSYVDLTQAYPNPRYEAAGFFVAAFCYLGWPWDFQPSDNFAANAATSDIVISTQITPLLTAHKARKYTRCFISLGTNDTSTLGNLDFTATTTRLMSIFTTLNNAGILPVHPGIMPRGVDASIQPYKQINQRINEWLYQLSLTGFIEYIPCAEMWADNTTAFGNILPSICTDIGTLNLHPNRLGAMIVGKYIADWYANKGIASATEQGVSFAKQQNDYFDRVNNKFGVFGTNPLLQGGTTAPTGFTTAGGTWSKVNRAALANGNIRSDPTCVLAASTTHTLGFVWFAALDWALSELQPGDVTESRCKVLVTGGVNITSIDLRVTNRDSSGNIQQTWCLRSGSIPGNMPDGSYTLYLKTPKYTILPKGNGTQNAYYFLDLTIITAAGGSGTVSVQGFESRIVA